MSPFTSPLLFVILQAEERDRLSEMTEDVSSEYVSIAVKALTYLSK